MVILNFELPLPARENERYAPVGPVGSAPSRPQNVRVLFDLEQPVTPQLRRLLDELIFWRKNGTRVGKLIVLPSLNYAAADVLVAELHGRMGDFSAILRLRPRDGALVTEYHAAETIYTQTNTKKGALVTEYYAEEIINPDAPVGLPAFVTNAQPRATHTADDSDTVNSRVSNVQPRATRRTHTAEYKLQILAEADACRRGKIGELLRREGLCYSHLAKWRGEREAGTLADRLVREYAALKRKLKQADAIIEAQKNLARLLERDMASAVMVRMESQS